MATDHEISPGADLMAPVQVRQMLGVSLRTYQRYVADGTLVAAEYTLKGHRRFRRSDVEALRQGVAEAKAAEGATA
jgi:predicted site-specific integrase-resolvase